MQSNRKEKLLWGTQEAADEIGIDVKSLRRELEAGRIPGQRIGTHWKVPLWWIKQQRDGKVA